MRLCDTLVCAIKTIGARKMDECFLVHRGEGKDLSWFLPDQCPPGTAKVKTIGTVLQQQRSRKLEPRSGAGFGWSQRVDSNPFAFDLTRFGEDNPRHFDLPLVHRVIRATPTVFPWPYRPQREIHVPQSLEQAKVSIRLKPAGSHDKRIIGLLATAEEKTYEFAPLSVPVRFG